MWHLIANVLADPLPRAPLDHRAAVVPSGQIGDSVQPVLQAEGMVLRPWVVEDAASVVAAYADPELERWHVRSMTRVEATEWIRAGRAAWREETAASWAIQAAGAVMGRMTLKLRLSHGLAEAAYWTVPAARGRRVATVALVTVTRWAFGIGLHRVQLEHSTQNVLSCRVAGRAGFSVEGTRRSAVLHGDGWHDMHLHSRVIDSAVDRA